MLNYRTIYQRASWSDLYAWCENLLKCKREPMSLDEKCYDAQPNTGIVWGNNPTKDPGTSFTTFAVTLREKQAGFAHLGSMAVSRS